MKNYIVMVKYNHKFLCEVTIKLCHLQQFHQLFFSLFAFCVGVQFHQLFFSLFAFCVGVPLSWRVDGKKTEVRLPTSL